MDGSHCKQVSHLLAPEHQLNTNWAPTSGVAQNFRAFWRHHGTSCWLAQSQCCAYFCIQMSKVLKLNQLLIFQEIWTRNSHQLKLFNFLIVFGDYCILTKNLKLWNENHVTGVKLWNMQISVSSKNFNMQCRRRIVSKMLKLSQLLIFREVGARNSFINQNFP